MTNEINKEIYLDNSATTKCFDEVIDMMDKLMGIDYGNPSSMHIKGFEAENYLKEARQIFADILKVKEKEIIFTSGGSESDNLAIVGAALANERRGKHIITTKIEHPAVSACMKSLEESGFSVDYLGVDSNGIISLEELREKLRDDTILVSIMHVNNEIGAIEPIEEAAKIIKDYNQSIIFHVDDIQGFGKIKIYPSRIGIDLLSISGHKIHGPKGTGVLYASSKVKLSPLILGGGQQGGMRSGTENVPGYASMALAAKMIYKDIDAHTNRLYELRDYFVSRAKEIEGVSINGGGKEIVAPHIVSLTLFGVRSEVLLHSLEDRKIYVSAGSACSSHKRAPSPTLSGIGLDASGLESTVRFSFSINTTKEEIDSAIDTLSEIAPVLTKYRRK